MCRKSRKESATLTNMTSMEVWKEAGLVNESGACLTVIGLSSELNLLNNDHHHLTRLLLYIRTVQAAIITQAISRAVEGMANTPKKIPSKASVSSNFASRTMLLSKILQAPMALVASALIKISEGSDSGCA